MSETQIKKLKASRDIYAARIKDIYKIAQSAEADPQYHTSFKTRFAALEHAYAKFQEHHLNLVQILSVTEGGDLVGEDLVRSQVDNYYFDILSSHFDLFSKSVDPDPAATRASAPNTRLAPLGVPTFNGDLKGWHSWHDLYVALIHTNNSFRDVEKFNYLLLSLTDDVKSIISQLPVTDANYKIAYKSLLDRYQNKRILASHYWNTIVDLEGLDSENSPPLRKFLDIFNENLLALKSLGFPVQHWDFVLFSLMMRKISVDLATRFELQNTDELPTYDKLKTFLTKQCSALESLAMNMGSASTSEISSKFSSQKSKNSPRFSKQKSNSQNSPGAYFGSFDPCPLCPSNSEHVITKCSVFLKKTPNERHSLVREHHLCLNCLKGSHSVAHCPSSYTCKKCNFKHNTLLHFSKPSGSNPSSSQRSSQPQQRQQTENTSGNLVTSPDNAVAHVVSTQRGQKTTCLLATARLDILDAWGMVHNIRVFLDSGSEINLITEKCFRKLGLSYRKTGTKICGIGGIETKALGTASCSLRPSNQINPIYDIDALILPKVCSNMPRISFENRPEWTHISNLEISDPGFNCSAEIDMLLGIEIFGSCLKGGKILGKNPDEPIALETIFGWVLMGKVAVSQVPSVTCAVASLVDDSRSLECVMKRFWEVEEPPYKSLVSPDDELCEKKYVECVSRNESGHYVVALPFKQSEEPILSNTRSLALRRFLSLERRLLKDPLAYKQYSEHMQEYLDSKYMILVPKSEENISSYIIPHHAVFKPGSTTSHIRVVYDASAKLFSDENSLNDTLLVGPKLQNNIVDILLRFRLHNYVLVSDIRKMYLQIQIKPDDYKYQRILWRFSPHDEVSTYSLTTVTFGVSSSPFLALRTIAQLVKDEGHAFPLASIALSSDIYIDDVVTGQDKLEDAFLLQNQLMSLLERGGFELRKWSSNQPSLISHLPESLRLNSALSMDLDSESDSFVKILGFNWHPSRDVFSYQVNPLDRNCTKRTMLSELARAYDPLGLICPVTFFTKHLIQYLFTLGLDWDEDPPVDVKNKWSRYKSELREMSSIEVSRKLTENLQKSYELHGFCDASLKGYAAVIYIRITTSTGEIKTHLVMAKSKVAPIKNTISLPKLELCGATLLSDLMAYVLDVYKNKIKFEKIVAWCDSMVALAWIKSLPYKLKCFVANRVSKIQSNISPSSWNYVPTDKNPADYACRGMMPHDLVLCSTWWNGPEFLSEEILLFDPPDIKDFSSVIGEEERNIVLVAITEVSFPLNLLDKYSSLQKIQRIVAIFRRFIVNCKNKDEKTKRRGPLIEIEFYEALVFLAKMVQRVVFEREIECLQNGQLLSKPLRKLAPFIDKDGILRVGGRISNCSSLSFDRKFPILLPQKHKLTRLIVQDFHNRNYHPGLQTLQFLIGQQFWILSPKRAIYNVISQCIKCFKLNPKSVEPLMANLPATRLEQVKPFSCTGVDMAGPFDMLLFRGRGARVQKAYLCLFVCFTVKAVHFEITTDMSSDCFLAALRRFIARRGRCSMIFSDCGSNFVGAQRELMKSMQEAVESEKISWSFNPPSSPHFGGLWEAGVKSAKTHFARVVGNQKLTYEELNTVFVQVESMLNSRPLCSVSSDPMDLTALTPGHFLVLEPLTAVPSPNLTDLNINRLDRWQLLSRMTQDYWKRWSNEYIHTLQQRFKWNKASKPVETGMLVLIKHESTPPLQWRLGRIVKLHLGSDGICRVCTVKTAQGFFKRPVVKLCPLPSQ